jgi:MFS family permease
MNHAASKWSLAALFLVDGVGFGLWAAHVPIFQQQLRLGNGLLSVVLLALVVGSIISMPITGQVIARNGSRTVVRVAAVLYCAILFTLGQVSSFPLLLISALLYGAIKGALDVTVNAQAIALERHFKSSFMSLLQGCWSLGGLIGAGASSLCLRYGATLRLDLTVGAILMCAVVLLSLPWLISEPIRTTKDTGLAIPDGATLRLAAISFFGLFAEGAVGDWTAVFLHLNIGVSLSLAAAGYAAYAVAMAGARFSGHWILRCFTNTQILLGSGVLVALGFGAVLALHSWWGSLAGLILTGVGIANVIPIVMTVAGKNTRIGAGPAISAVSTVGYFGFLAGPPLIGWCAVHVGLGKALVLVVVAGLMVACGPLFLLHEPIEAETVV